MEAMSPPVRRCNKPPLPLETPPLPVKPNHTFISQRLINSMKTRMVVRASVKDTSAVPKDVPTAENMRPTNPRARAAGVFRFFEADVKIKMCKDKSKVNCLNKSKKT